jgi:hypothetical protein
MDSPRNVYGQEFADSTAELRVCDLISLIDSAVLHEQIFYLPASLPDDAGGLDLRNRLIAAGALAPLPEKDDHNTIGQALLASLGTVDGFPAVMAFRAGGPHTFDDIKPQLVDELGLTISKGDVAGNRPSLLTEGYETASALSHVAATAKSFDEAARDLIYRLWEGGSGRRYGDGRASLRAMYYVFASEHYSLPYLPSSSVRAVAQGFPNYLHPSVRDKLYQQLSSALQTAVETVAREFDGIHVFVPPFPALVLSRASTPARIPSEVLALREEYSDFRGKMRELERERLQATSINDRLMATRQIEQLGKEVARPFAQPSRMKIESALRYIPDAAGVAANPTNPVGWAQLLLGKPTEALVSWYRRRPVAKLVRTAKDVGAMSDYDGLLAKHFGQEATARILEIQNVLHAT